ncbi:MAG: hypothetical protein AB7S26_35550 [Sandaracinaceae bacterium]
MKNIARIAIPILLITSLAGCHREVPTVAHRADMLDHHGVREHVRGEARRDGKGESAADVAVRGWPDGWMITEDDSYIPVVDEMGRDLAAARADLRAGHRAEASHAVRRAADRLERTGPREGASPRVAQAVAQLRWMADDLATNRELDVARFDRLATDAYKADLDHAWVEVHDEGVTVFLERPGEHLAAARLALKEHHPEAAVDQLKRALALYRVEIGRVARSGDATTLNDRFDALDRYTTSVGRQEGEDAILEARIAGLETAFAEHYVHRARIDLEAHRDRDAGHALLALALHLDRQLSKDDATTSPSDRELIGALHDDGLDLASGEAVDGVRDTIAHAEARLHGLATPAAVHTN